MILESVPNISEGRDLSIIDACVQAVERAGARVLHRTSDAIHNRSVLTVAGQYEALRDATLALATVTVERIDLRTHTGVHPRIGALDVLPFIPLRDATMDDAVRLAREVAAAIWERLRVPSFLYAEAAMTQLRRNLANVRQGQFEGLDVRFDLPEWRPDFGDVPKHMSAGAFAVGARELLIAFNIEIATDDISIVRRIARQLRERDGGLRTLKALALRMGPGVVQVSLNVTDYRATPLYRIVELVRALAAQAGVVVLRSELIGCVPYDAVEAAAQYYLGIWPMEEA
jgi:glutamate formiminotransferase / 5-formyltetrahydrofolate cyclo-ligase